MIHRWLPATAVVLGWSLACGGGPQPTSPETDTAPTPAVAIGAPATWVPDPAWTAFFEERFGQSPTVTLEVKLSDDPELLARIGDRWFLFPLTGEPPPDTWTVLDGVDGTGARTLDHAATVAMAPELAEALPPGAGSATFGDPATVLVFRHSGEAAWVSVFPEEVSAEVAAARAHAPGAFEVSDNNLLGDAGFEGEAPLDQAFCGDFDGDGSLEVVLLTGGQVLRWVQGAPEPAVQPVEYLGSTSRKAALRRGPFTIHPFDEDAPIEVQGDALDIWKPEASSIVLYLDGDGWHEVFEGD